MPMKAREAIRRLKRDGWYVVNQEGSHMQFKHLDRVGKITVPDSPGDLKPKIEHNIKKMAGWK
ncbi:MAG: type II toxin-antitoxin system HicA family toxin [Clostridia bacterium]|nr:type II toxin-antitoxin system HicA family toxin [Clostridia bacterium]